MECVISRHEIAEKIEQTWIQEVPRTLNLEAYVEWLSRNWEGLSEADRDLLIAGGAAIFDVKMQGW